MKKIICLLLSVMLLLSCAPAANASDGNSTVEASYLSTEKNSISAEVVEEIYSKHFVGDIASVNKSNGQKLSTEEIEKELSHIYLDIEQAQKHFEDDPNKENELYLNNLIGRMEFFEGALTERGFIFLTDEEAQQLMGMPVVFTLDMGSKPSDTSNTQYVASSISNVTLSDGTKVYWYYVTAYARSSSSRMVRNTKVTISDMAKKSDVIGARIETQVGRLVNNLYWYETVTSWKPDEMITYTGDTGTSCTYTIDATYTATPRFIWASSQSSGTFYLEAITHQMTINNRHQVNYLYQGKAQIDSQTKTHTYSTPKFNANYIPDIIKDQWENNRSSAYIECVREVRYFYKAPPITSKNKLVSTQSAPYATGYFDMN